MKQRGVMELISTELRNGQPGNAELANTERMGAERMGTELIETEQQGQTDLDAALARTLRRFIAEVSKSDQPPAPSEAGQRRAQPIREQGKRAAHLLWGRREGAS
jgi:hypothetical protein